MPAPSFVKLETILNSADDRIFLGEGLFETIRVDNHQPCYAKLHWQRMRKGAAQLNIPFLLSSDAWCEALEQSILQAKIKNGGVKAILSGGCAARGLTNQGDAPYLLIKAFTYSRVNEPCSLVSASWLRDANNPVYQFKSVNYLESILARKQALAAGADDALFFNTLKQATETTVSNLFIIKEDQVYTPGLGCGLLQGIIRNRLIALCFRAGIPCKEKNLDQQAIHAADAVFVTNALQGIRVVQSLDGLITPVNHPIVGLLGTLLEKDKSEDLLFNVE